MSNYEEDELLSIAKMGVDAEAFMRTPLGRFLQKKAQDEIDAATNELIDAKPEDVELGREIRNRIHIAAMFLTWMRESINGGRAAYDQLKETEDQERHSG